MWFVWIHKYYVKYLCHYVRFFQLLCLCYVAIIISIFCIVKIKVGWLLDYHLCRNDEVFLFSFGEGWIGAAHGTRSVLRIMMVPFVFLLMLFP